MEVWQMFLVGLFGLIILIIVIAHISFRWNTRHGRFRYYKNYDGKWYVQEYRLGEWRGEFNRLYITEQQAIDRIVYLNSFYKKSEEKIAFKPKYKYHRDE